jgi:Tol biopolymer transport system component
LSHAERDELQVLSLASRSATPATIQTGWIRHPAFSPDGSKISYETAHAALEIDTHGGAAVDIFPNEDGYVSDWSSDGREFLWIGRTPDQPAIAVVDRATLKRTLVLNDPDCNLYQARFSPNQKYITFNAMRNQHSRIYAAPLRTGSVPAGDWIPLTNGATWDDKPRLSADGKLLFFVSDRDGFPCIWVQRLSPGMHPIGTPEEVFHSHSFRRSLAGVGLGDLELNVSRDMLIFGQGDAVGNIWVLDPPPEQGKR